MERNPASVEGGQTRHLIAKYTTIAVGVPAVILLLSYFVDAFELYEFESKDWKRAVFFSWFAAIALLFRAGIRDARGGRRGAAQSRKYREDRAESPAVLAGEGGKSSRQMDKWESKNTRQILSEFVAAFLFLPMAALALVGLYAYFSGRVIVGTQWVQIVGIVWLGSFICGLRCAYKAFRKRLG